MSLTPLPSTPRVTHKDLFTPIWQAWVHSIQQWLGPQGQTGITSARPTKSLYIGLSYFDTTLGYPVFVKQVSPSIVWVNASGATV